MCFIVCCHQTLQCYRLLFSYENGGEGAKGPAEADLDEDTMESTWTPAQPSPAPHTDDRFVSLTITYFVRLTCTFSIVKYILLEDLIKMCYLLRQQFIIIGRHVGGGAGGGGGRVWGRGRRWWRGGQQCGPQPARAARRRQGHRAHPHALHRHRAAALRQAGMYSALTITITSATPVHSIPVISAINILPHTCYISGS